MGNEITIEEKKKKVRDFRPIDDAFFEVLADDTGFCQEMLRILLDDEELIVEEVIVQSSERNIYGRSVRLDALCTFEDGKKCNVEVQRSDDDDHLRRVRFNASSIAVKDSQMGQKFREIEDIIVVYISKFDIFNANRVIYHVAKVKLNREQVRSKNKESLQAIIDNETLDDAQKKAAVDEMITLTDIAEKESNAEMMLEAKGFTDVVVSISEDACDVVLNMGEVTDAKRAQVEDIVKRKTGVAAENIVITPIE